MPLPAGHRRTANRKMLCIIGLMGVSRFQAAATGLILSAARDGEDSIIIKTLNAILIAKLDAGCDRAAA